MRQKEKTKKQRIQLTASEIGAILEAAGNVDAPATFEDGNDEKEADRKLEAFESGMEKLRHMLARKEKKSHEGDC